MDATWFSTWAINTLKSSCDRHSSSRVHCSACMSSSTRDKSASSALPSARKPGGRRQKSGSNGARVHCSSAKVRWSVIRRDPVRTQQSRSCLEKRSIRISDPTCPECTHNARAYLPEYRSLDAFGEIDAIGVADGHKLLHAAHVQLYLFFCPQACLYAVVNLKKKTKKTVRYEDLFNAPRHRPAAGWRQWLTWPQPPPCSPSFVG